MSSWLHLLRSALDRFTESHIGGAAAEVATHRFLDVRVAGPRNGFEQGDRAHDLPALAITALHNVLVDPGLLHGPADGILGEALDGDDGSIADQRHRHEAGATGHAAQAPGARADRADAQ